MCGFWRVCIWIYICKPAKFEQATCESLPSLILCLNNRKTTKPLLNYCFSVGKQSCASQVKSLFCSRLLSMITYTVSTQLNSQCSCSHKHYINEATSIYWALALRRQSHLYFIIANEWQLLHHVISYNGISNESSQRKLATESWLFNFTATQPLTRHHLSPFKSKTRGPSFYTWRLWSSLVWSRAEIICWIINQSVDRTLTATVLTIDLSRQWLSKHACQTFFWFQLLKCEGLLLFFVI